MPENRKFSKTLTFRVAISGLAIALAVPVLLWLGGRWFDGPEGKYLDSAGVKIHYTIDGNGPPLLLLHGLLLNGNVQWRVSGLVAELARHYTVVNIDLRGHGRSGKPLEPEAYGMEAVEDLARLMDALGLEKAHLAGVSLGGLVAERFMIAHPDRVLTVKIAAQGLAEPNKENLALANGIADALQQGKGVGPLTGFIGMNSPIEKFGLWFVANFLNEPVAVAGFVRQIPTLAVPQEQIKANQTPLYIVIGDNDGFLPWAQAVASIKPNTTLQVLPGRYHMNVGAGELMDVLIPKTTAAGTTSKE